MSWWVWLLIWAFLFGAALVVFVVIGLSLWRQVRELSHEVKVASERFALISAQLEKITAATADTAEPAIFDDAATLKREREKTVRRAKAMTTMRIRALPGKRAS